MCTADGGPVSAAPACGTRRERDGLGERDVPADALYGIHTVRALGNFDLSGRRVHAGLVHAFGQVKLAAARTNRALGQWAGEPAKADAIERACGEMSRGHLDGHVVVDALQGGAGTSTNMNVNEVLANRALRILGRSPGDYDYVSPLRDLNLHQSTNDTYPTALKLAAVTGLRNLEERLVALQEAFQGKEKEFDRVVKVGRTQLQDAVLVTLGREMGAYAEAFGRDRWRVYKCEERLRTVNLGGTAVGTGIAAPREYVLRAVEALRGQTGIGFARAENLVDNTQNADVFVEVSGILKACAASLIKVSTDLRILASGPRGGIGELRLPPVQAGSSIMPGKVNPVIPEAVAQAAMRMTGYDAEITMAAAAGNLELNAFLPLVADALLHGIDLLANACRLFAVQCVEGLKADESRCRANMGASTATATALLPAAGYDGAARIAEYAYAHGCTIREAALGTGLVDGATFDRLTSPEAVMRLGTGGGRQG